MNPDEWMFRGFGPDRVRDGYDRARTRDEQDALRRMRALERPGDVPGVLILHGQCRDMTGQGAA